MFSGILEPQISSRVRLPDSNVTRRSNASGRSSGSLRRAQNAERRNPDTVLSPAGPVSIFLEPELSRDEVPGESRRLPPDSDEQQGLMDFSGDLNHTKDGSVI